MAQNYGKCPFPSCERRVIPNRSPHDLCIEHEKFLSDLLFILPHIKVEQARKAGLVLPGDKEFKTLPVEVVK